MTPALNAKHLGVGRRAQLLPQVRQASHLRRRQRAGGISNLAIEVGQPARIVGQQRNLGDKAAGELVGSLLGLAWMAVVPRPGLQGLEGVSHQLLRPVPPGNALRERVAELGEPRQRGFP